MTRAFLIGVAGLMLAIAPACAADAKAEIDFVTRASIANLAAVAESQLALDRLGDTQVKTFAHRLVEAHVQAEAALDAASAGSGATVAAKLDQEHEARMAALAGKSGADFEKAYVADQAEVHSNALTLYADYMLLGDNATLKALAVKMIPITEAQFKEAQALSSE